MIVPWVLTATLAHQEQLAAFYGKGRRRCTPGDDPTALYAAKQGVVLTVTL